MIYYTTKNALPVKQKMKNAFCENHIFTRFNLSMVDWVELKPFGLLLCSQFPHLYDGLPHLAAGVAVGHPGPSDDPALSHAHHLQYSIV